jgi:hypothetical protein
MIRPPTFQGQRQSSLTYWSEDFAFPVSDVIPDGLCFNDLLAFGL